MKTVIFFAVGVFSFHCVFAATVKHPIKVLEAISARNYSEAEIKRMKILDVKTPKDIAEIKKLIEANRHEVIAEGSTFLTFRPHPELTTQVQRAFTKKLAADARVKKIEPETLMYALDAEDFGTHAVGERKYQRPGADLKPTFKAVAGCQIFPDCNGGNPAWASMQVGADLAEEYVERYSTLTRGELANVGVVDSGFDIKQRAGLMVEEFNTFKGFKEAENEDIDPDGHGTAVLGTIAGKYGITKHIELRSYRTTGKNAGGSTSSGALAAAIEKACLENDVVNVSWGSLLEEAMDYDYKNARWYKKAEDLGCIVVKSAGNGGYQDVKKSKSDPNSPVFTAGAASQFGTPAGFSSVGEFYAPGQNVYALRSSHARYSEYGNSCQIDGHETGTISGTSFSAPIIAGVVGQVMTILKKRGVLPMFPYHRERPKWIRAILAATAAFTKLQSGTDKPSINAAFAALIANEIGKSNTDFSEKALIELVQNSHEYHGRCHDEPKNCSFAQDCAEQKRCVSQLRFYNAVCLPPAANDPKSSLVASNARSLLLSVLDRGKQREQLYQLAAQMAKDEKPVASENRSPNPALFTPFDSPATRVNTDATPAADPVKQKLYESLNSNWSSVLSQGSDGKPRDHVDGFKLGEAVGMLNLMRDAGDPVKMKVADKLFQLINSPSGYSLFSFSRPWGSGGSQSAEETKAGQIVASFLTLPIHEQEELLARFEKTLEGRGWIGLLYTLTKHKLPDSIREKVVGYQKKYASDLLSGKASLDDLVAHTSLPALDEIFTSDEKIRAGLVKLVSSGNLIKESKNGVKSNLGLFIFAVQSEKILGDQKLGIVARLLETGQVEDRSFNILYQAGLATLASEPNPTKQSITRIRNLLLQSKYVPFPPELFPYFRSDNTKVTEALRAEPASKPSEQKDAKGVPIQKGLLEELVEDQARKGKTYFASGTADMLDGNVNIQNVHTVLKQIDEAKRKDLLKPGQPLATLIKSFFSEAVTAFTSKNRSVKYAANSTLRSIFRESDLWENSGFTPEMASALEPLKGICAKDKKECSDFDTSLKKLFNLDEI